eukprot:UN24912
MKYNFRFLNLAFIHTRRILHATCCQVNPKSLGEISRHERNKITTGKKQWDFSIQSSMMLFHFQKLCFNKFHFDRRNCPT